MLKKIYRGKVSLKQNKVLDAQKDFLKAIEINKDKFSAYIGLGDCNRIRGDYPAAIKNYSIVIDDDEQLMEIIGLKRVSCYIELKEFTKAIQDIEKVIRLLQDSQSKPKEL